MNTIKKHWIAIAVCVVCAIVFFFIGMFVGKGTASQTSTGRGYSSSSARGFSGASRGGNGGGFASGQVTAKDNQTITFQLPNGNSEVVLYSSSTQVSMPTTASLNDVTVGAQVMIGGTQNADGSVTAQSIQIRTASTPNGPAGATGK